MSAGHPISDGAFRRYLLEIKGKVLAEFCSCRGLGNQEIRKPVTSAMSLESEAHSKVIELEHGSTTSLFIWDWYSSMFVSKPQKMGITVVERDEHGEEIERWAVSDAWPVNWLGQAQAIDERNISIRSLEICHSGTSRETE